MLCVHRGLEVDGGGRSALYLETQLKRDFTCGKFPVTVATGEGHYILVLSGFPLKVACITSA